MSTKPVIAGPVLGKPPITHVPTPTTPAPPPPAVVPPIQSASDLMKDTLTTWGLTDLLPNLQQYLIAGYDSTTINLYLQQTPEWKTRFAGNELRKQNGLAVLTPAQYISNEEQYRNVMQSYGLPSGFYDNHSDFVNFIGNDVSPTEISQRAKIAHDQYLAAPPETKALWNQYYGMGDAIAGILDPKVATQVIADRAATVDIGGAAASQGLQVGVGRATQFQQKGVTLSQAQAAYSKIAQYAQPDAAIGNRFDLGADNQGNKYGTQANEEDQLLLNNGSAMNQAVVGNASERGLFQGHAGANTASLGVSQELAATNG